MRMESLVRKNQGKGNNGFCRCVHLPGYLPVTVWNSDASYGSFIVVQIHLNMRSISILSVVSISLLCCEGNDNSVYSPLPSNEFLISDSIPVPALSGGKFIESPGYGLSWSRSCEECQYQLVSSAWDSFPSYMTIYRGYNTDISVGTNIDYYKVRAFNGGYASRWSNVVKP